MLDKKLIDLLKPLKIKYFYKRFIHVITIFLMISGGISLAVMTVSRVIPITFIWNRLLVILVCSLALGALWSIYKKPSYKDTAILIDSFGLKERTATALELKGEDTLVARLQKEDTIRLLEKKELRSKISLRPSMKILLCIFIFLVATITVGFIPTKSYVDAREREKNIEKLEEEKVKIEKVKKDIKKDEKLSPEEKKKIEKALEKLKKEIEESKNTKKAQKELIKAKKELNKIKEDIKERKINETARKLSNNGFTKELAQKLKNRDAHETAKEIKEMAERIKNSNKEELEKLAKELKDLQEMLKNNPELAKALKEIADAVAQSAAGNSNNEAINQSLQNLSKAINSQLNNSQVSKSLNEALNNLDELSNTLSQMSGEASLSHGDNEGTGEGAVGQPSENGSNGQEQGGSEGNSGSGQCSIGGQEQGGSGGNPSIGQGENGQGSSGAGEGSTPGNEGGGGGSPNGVGGKKESIGKEAVDYEKIFAPKRLDTQGEGTNIRGNVNKSGQKDTIEVKKFGEDMGEAIPFREVINSYRSSEYEKLEEEEIPPNMKDVVKMYFIKLDE